MTRASGAHSRNLGMRMADAKKILITGANGFVGRALCREAARRGLQSRGATRLSEQLPDGTEPAVVGSIDDKTNWQTALQDVGVIIHLAARVHVMQDDAADPLAEFSRVNVAGTERLARAAADNGIKRLVYVSSIKVNGEETTEGHRYSELDQPSPQDPYGISKWEAEQALHRVANETGLEVVILRPPLVYGGGVKGNFALMLKALANGMPLPLASVTNSRSLLYVGNLVDALLTCAEHPAAKGQTYLICDGEDISTPALLRQLGKAVGRPAHLLPFPETLLKLGGRLLGKSGQVNRLLGSLQVDSSKICRELGWQPPYTVQQGLQATAEWFLSDSAAR